MKHEIKSLDEIKQEEWNSLITKDKNTGMYQTYEFAEYWNDYLKCKPHFLYIYEDDKAVGCLLFFKQAIAHKFLFEKPVINKLIPLLTFLKPVYCWINGPVILDKKMKEKVFDYIFKNASQLFPRYYAIRGSYKDYESDEKANEEIKDTLQQYSVSCKMPGTYVIDLSKSLDELWKNLSKACRKNIKKVPKLGVKFYKDNNVQSVSRFHKIYKNFRKNMNETYFSIQNFHNQIKYMNSADAEMAFYICELNEEVVSGLGIQKFNKLVYEVISARNTKEEMKKIPAGDYIKWQVIEHAKKKGCRLYDLMGAEPIAEDKKLQNIERFKRKFGGKFIRYLEFEKK